MKIAVYQLYYTHFLCNLLYFRTQHTESEWQSTVSQLVSTYKIILSELSATWTDCDVQLKILWKHFSCSAWICSKRNVAATATAQLHWYLFCSKCECVRTFERWVRYIGLTVAHMHIHLICIYVCMCTCVSVHCAQGYGGICCCCCCF